MRLETYNGCCMTVLCENGNITDAATKTAGIYYWRNNINGKGYVGKTLNLQYRMNDYVKMRFKLQRVFYAAVQKYGLENFTCYKIMDCCPSNVALNYWETYWIGELDTFIDGGNGYNLTTGGDGGKLMSAESRRKISAANKGKVRSVEHRQRISLGHKGIPKSLDWRRNMSLRMIGNSYGNGHIVSEDHKQKIRESRIGNKVWLGRKHSDASKKKIGWSLRNMNPELRKRLNDANSARIVSTEIREVLRRTQLLRWGTLWKDFFIYE